MPPRRGWRFLETWRATEISLLTELSPTTTRLHHSAQRWSEATTLGERAKMVTTLKELWQRGGEFDATPSGLMILWGRFPRVARHPSGSDRQPWAERWI